MMRLSFAGEFKTINLDAAGTHQQGLSRVRDFTLTHAPSREPRYELRRRSIRARQRSGSPREVAGVVRGSGIGTGLCVVFLRHTSASLVVQENADAAVLRDLERWIEKLAPEDRAYEHDPAGADDM